MTFYCCLVTFIGFMFVYVFEADCRAYYSAPFSSDNPPQQNCAIALISNPVRATSYCCSDDIFACITYYKSEMQKMVDRSTTYKPARMEGSL